MVFVIQGMKYDMEKMQKIATVKKWYREDTFLNRAMFPGQEVGQTHIGRKAAIMAIKIILAAAGAATLILAALGLFAYAVVAKAWNELFD